MSHTLVLIPVYNEESSIGKVLDEINGLELDVDIIVIDDGSVDRTADIVRQKGIQIIFLPYNLGYGGALQTGFKYAVSKDYKYLIQFDGDGQHDALNIVQIMDTMEKENADIVIGSRFLSAKHGTGFLKSIVIKIFRLIIKLLTGCSVTDPTSGLQGLSRKAFCHYSRMGNYPADFPDADILITMLSLKYKVVEIPANIRNRTSGVSMHAGLRTLFYMVKIMISIFVVILRTKVVQGGREVG